MSCEYIESRPTGQANLSVVRVNPVKAENPQEEAKEDQGKEENFKTIQVSSVYTEAEQ